MWWLFICCNSSSLDASCILIVEVFSIWTRPFPTSVGRHYQDKNSSLSMKFRWTLLSPNKIQKYICGIFIAPFLWFSPERKLLHTTLKRVSHWIDIPPQYQIPKSHLNNNLRSHSNILETCRDLVAGNMRISFVRYYTLIRYVCYWFNAK